MHPSAGARAKMSSALDGRRFAGDFGPENSGRRVKDTFVFSSGTFMSMQCKECGYPRGAYSVTKKAGATTFVATTPCPKTDARIVWRGTISGDRIVGVATWTRTRWYRTIRKNFTFKGKLVRRQDAKGE